MSKSLVVCLLCLLVCAQAVVAGPVTTDVWYGFYWLPVVGGDIGGGSPGNAPWTITNASTVYFTIVDGFLSGDRFEAFDNSISLGQTSVPTLDGDGCVGGNSPGNCLLDPRFTKGIFALSAGIHSLTIEVTADPWDGGGAYFAVLSRNPTGVPEPATFTLAGVGLALAAFRCRRRRPVNG